MSNDLTKQDVQQLEQAISRVEKKVDAALSELRLDLKKIEGYLYDDDNTSTPGIVQKVREHEHRISTIEESERTRKRVFATLGVLGGVIGMAIIEFLKWIINNK